MAFFGFSFFIYNVTLCIQHSDLHEEMDIAHHSAKGCFILQHDQRQQIWDYIISDIFISPSVYIQA